LFLRQLKLQLNIISHFQTSAKLNFLTAKAFFRYKMTAQKGKIEGVADFYGTT